MTRLRKIDAQTGDYTIQDGEFVESTGIESQVVIRLRTPRGSFIPNPDFGNRLYTLRKAGTDLQRRVPAFVAEALQDLVDRGSIRNVVTDEVSVSGGRISYRVTYEDTSGTRNVVNLSTSVG